MSSQPAGGAAMPKLAARNGWRHGLATTWLVTPYLVGRRVVNRGVWSARRVSSRTTRRRRRLRIAFQSSVVPHVERSDVPRTMPCASAMSKPARHKRCVQKSLLSHICTQVSDDERAHLDPADKPAKLTTTAQRSPPITSNATDVPVRPEPLQLSEVVPKPRLRTSATMRCNNDTSFSRCSFRFVDNSHCRRAQGPATGSAHIFVLRGPAEL
mmetsp:Transcript_56672/g.158987  ORF Transcript_56672/g.158987 Transcript_56672/m.158987 type:complete len:212 (-) Transcript_56672:138-773(-)